MLPSQERRHEAFFPTDADFLPYEGKTIYDYLFGQPDFDPKLPAFSYLDTRISYGTFKEECDKAWDEVESELRAICASELPDYKQPTRYEPIDTLPLTPLARWA